MQKSIVKFIVVCAALAFHELWFKPVWVSWLTAQGKIYDTGTALIGYSIIMGSAWVLAYFITRPMKKVSNA